MPLEFWILFPQELVCLAPSIQIQVHIQKGRAKGSLSARLAQLIFNEVIMRSDYLIDVHPAPVVMVNCPKRAA